MSVIEKKVFKEATNFIRDEFSEDILKACGYDVDKYTLVMHIIVYFFVDERIIIKKKIDD